MGVLPLSGLGLELAYESYDCGRVEWDQGWFKRRKSDTLVA